MIKKEIAFFIKASILIEPVIIYHVYIKYNLKIASSKSRDVFLLLNNVCNSIVDVIYNSISMTSRPLTINQIY